MLFTFSTLLYGQCLCVSISTYHDNNRRSYTLVFIIIDILTRLFRIFFASFSTFIRHRDEKKDNAPDDHHIVMCLFINGDFINYVLFFNFFTISLWYTWCWCYSRSVKFLNHQLKKVNKQDMIRLLFWIMWKTCFTYPPPIKSPRRTLLFKYVKLDRFLAKLCRWMRGKVKFEY